MMSSNSSSSTPNEVKLADNGKAHNPSDNNVEEIQLCDTIPDWVLRSYLNGQVFRDAVSRSIKPPRRLLPLGWETDWFGWDSNDDLREFGGISVTEIILQGKFNIAFQHVQLIMYDSNSPDETVVFLYHGRFYKYPMMDQELFIYPDRYKTIKDLLQDWETAERDVDPVEELRDGWSCNSRIYGRLGLEDAYMAEVYRRWGRNYRDHSEWFRSPRHSTWDRLWVNTITPLLSRMFGYWLPI
ncbi:hypothetical protein C8J56DRAFT_1166866 [Mycena floridula]|nr:hypothetical protein C8J56DRAFT_1166866 [Mycena floridula]